MTPALPRPPLSPSSGKYKSTYPPGSATFPIMVKAPLADSPGRFAFEGLGTGFFVLAKPLLFVTARHVVADHLHLQDDGGLGAWVITAGGVFTCPIIGLVLHPTADLAVGAVKIPMENGKPHPAFKISYVTLAGTRPPPGAKVVTYGYPRTRLTLEDNDTVGINVWPDWYEGQIVAYHDNGFTVSKWPVVQHTAPLASGMSGGPLFHHVSGDVLGVNCSGWSTETVDDPGGTSTLVELARELQLEPPAVRTSASLAQLLQNAKGGISSL